jgi:hypothetical protein
MSDHGIFSGYSGLTPHHEMAKFSKPVNTKMSSMSTLPGIIQYANPRSAMTPAVSKVVGAPDKNLSVTRGMYLERVKPTATKSTPGMIQLEMR